MSDTKGYNGYTNYETWAVALWLDNDEPLYREARAILHRTAKHTEAHELGNLKYALATNLEHWVGEMAPELGASMWSDLLTHSLGRVEWGEIAENYLSELREEMERETDGEPTITLSGDEWLAQNPDVALPKKDESKS